MSAPRDRTKDLIWVNEIDDMILDLINQKWQIHYAYAEADVYQTGTEDTKRLDTMTARIETLRKQEYEQDMMIMEKVK